MAHRVLPTSLVLPSNLLARYRFTAALWGWSYAFERPSPVIDTQSFGLEIGVMLSGARSCVTAHGPATYERGRLSVFDLGEHYVTQYDPRLDARGREVGFLVRTDRIASWTSPERYLRFPPRDEITDARLVDLAEVIAHGVDRGYMLGGEEVEAEVRRFVEANGELLPIDPLERARLELVRHFDRPLYMRYFADIAGVHEETFARKFAARYGVTPTRYRVLIRLKEAAVLLATTPDLPVREVAKRVGIDDPAYFHRAFAKQFGATPLALARGFSEPIAASIAVSA